ncbi:TD and POZ domain-containing protein 1 [Araneus ventricosus]|uniref:TD and POZ domain-containing protein 1 n=1 Tax=Araneus ventricosus TaxID=182803 RepID=A0A4Y2D568_ARAVE|nr:TD and POZ domain-containing protein 1 [Araneus ventricosus]
MESKKCFSFTWILENIAYCILEKGEALESPTFIVDTIEKTKWSLRIYPRNITDENNISFYLRRENSKGPDRIEIGYELAFLAADGSILKSLVFQRQAFKKNKGHGEASFETRENVFVKNRFKFLPGGTLMARCRIWKSDGEVKTHGQCVARTRFAVERRCFLWKMEKIRTFKPKKENMLIRSVSSDTPILSLDLRVEQNFIEKAEIIYVFISSAMETATFIFTLEVSLLDSKGIPVDCGQYEVRLNSLVQEEIALPLTKDFLTANSQTFLPNDTLTLLFNCAFSAGVISEGIESISYGIRSECIIPLPANNAFFKNAEVPDVEKNADPLISSKSADVEIQGLKEDIIYMLKENIQCDVKLSVDTETFPAHWFILSARSPVFRAMFKSDMKEKAKERIDIEDLKPDTVRRMLLYMYTDTLEEFQWETACALYTAADKYEILALKDKCSTFLKTNLSLTNACKVLVLADLHQDKDLKSIIQNFILKRDVDIINSDDWKVLMETNAHLAAETMFLKFKK